MGRGSPDSAEAWKAVGAGESDTDGRHESCQRPAIHPAIVAGRVETNTGNYRLLSQFVGTGEVRRQFGMAV